MSTMNFRKKEEWLPDKFGKPFLMGKL